MKKKEIEQRYAEKHPQTVAELIASLPLDPEYKPVPDLPIPLGRSVLVKKIKQSVIQQTESGIMLFDGSAENSTPPHLGILYAVGPDCPPLIRVGLRYYYNFFVDSFFRIGGVDYAKMDYMDLYYIVKPKVLTIEKVKSHREVDRKKRIERNNTAAKNIHKKELEEKDLEDFLKGRNYKA